MLISNIVWTVECVLVVLLDCNYANVAFHFTWLLLMFSFKAIFM